MNPKVTVIIPTYQHADVVDDAIESVLNQTYHDFELIIVDDGSIDNTQEVLKKYSDNKKVTVIKKKNAGVSAARNTGIAKSNGSYIAFLDADDIWTSEKLAIQVPLLQENLNLGLVYSNVNFFGHNGAFPSTLFQINPPKRGYVICDIFAQNCIPMPTSIVRRETFDDVGFFDKNLSTCADYDMWLRIARKWAIDYVDKPLAYYRFSENQMHKDRERWLIEKVAALEKAYRSDKTIRHMDKAKLESCFYNRILMLAKLHIKYGREVEAIRCLRKYQKYMGITTSFAKVILFFFRFNIAKLVKG